MVGCGVAEVGSVCCRTDLSSRAERGGARGGGIDRPVNVISAGIRWHIVRPTRETQILPPIHLYETRQSR